MRSVNFFKIKNEILRNSGANSNEDNGLCYDTTQAEKRSFIAHKE